MKELIFNPKCKYNWKPGDEIICIQNAGRTSSLTIGKTYKVIRTYKHYGADEVELLGDCGTIQAFSSRFTTLKIQRKEKLEKLNDK